MMKNEKKGIRKFITGVTKKFLHYVGVYKPRGLEIEELKRNGMKVGKNVLIDPRVMIDRNFSYLISIGDNSTICADVKLLAHDTTVFRFANGHGRAGRIDIKENCIISVGAIIMPGVTIGPNALIGAGSVVNKDIPPNSCVAGVPARYYGSFKDMVEKHKRSLEDGFIVDGREILGDGPISDERKQELLSKSEDGPIYLKNIHTFHNYPLLEID